MDFRKFASGFAPLAAIGLAAMVSACHHADISINGDAGKPLSELDMTGAPPHALVLLGPDKVQIHPGEKLAVTVDGDKDKAEKLRFTLQDGTIGILRRPGDWSGGDGLTVTVTMPPPRSLTMTGSGKITAATLAPDAQISIAGSGDIVTPGVASEKLSVSIAGSGTYTADGKVGVLDISIAGSGNATMAGLKADKGSVSIVGSGDATFASDGAVNASMIGSGSVHVKGRAQCTVSATGSGKLVCEP